MTNFEKFKSITIDELASFLESTSECCDFCSYDRYVCIHDCEYGIKKYLESEVTNND